MRIIIDIINVLNARGGTRRLPALATHRFPYRTRPGIEVAGMGLLTVIRKNQRKEREMRVLFLCGKSPEAPQSALIPSQNSDA